MRLQSKEQLTNLLLISLAGYLRLLVVLGFVVQEDDEDEEEWENDEDEWEDDQEEGWEDDEWEDEDDEWEDED